jgi:hypothetical protein
MKITQSLLFVCFVYVLVLFSGQSGKADDSVPPQAGTLTNTPAVAGGAAMVVVSNGVAGNDLSSAQILEKAREKYASLTTYGDEGWVVSTLNDTVINTSFTIRLARTNFYWIGWQQSVESLVSTNNIGLEAAWSSGAGDFLDAGLGPQNEESTEIALAKASENSGGAAVTIPRTFFNIPWGDQLGDAWSVHDRLADENVGGVDCYVLSTELQGRTRTLWIGRQDYLIHQVRTVTSADAMREMLTAASNGNDELISGIQSLTLTETHTNIIVNKPYARADFIPSNGE